MPPHASRRPEPLHELGQFFVQDLGGDTPPTIPIDNFVFIAEKRNTEVRIACVGWQSVVTFREDGEDKYEWYDNHAESMRRVADIMDGLVSWEEFATIASPGSYRRLQVLLEART